MQTIYLDISNRGVIPVIYAKQGDVGRRVEVVLTNSGLPYEPEAGSAFSAWFSGASGVGNYTDIGDHSAFSVSGNKVTVELITQMLQNAGEGFLCLVLSRAGGDQIGLWNIRYICEGVPGAGSEPAEDYYTAFSAAVAGLAYPDSSLSVAGKAADAAAVGAALAGKAPAGYGLGVASSAMKRISTVAELDSIADNRWVWYGSETSAIVVSGNNIKYAFGKVDTYDTDAALMTLYPVYPKIDSTLVRRKTAGVWGEFEYENPPMVLGVEYRTTERWNGKVVYARCESLGACPDSTYKNVTISTDAFCKVFDCRGYAADSGSSLSIPFWDTYAAWGSSAIKLYTHSENGKIVITVHTGGAQSNRTAYASLKYVKD